MSTSWFAALLISHSKVSQKEFHKKNFSKRIPLSSSQMSAWIEEGQEQAISETDKVFEDNFVSSEIDKQSNFKKLEDSDDYLKLLGKSPELLLCT